MATIKLYGRDQVVDERLPRICIKCGQDATSVKRRKFSWAPQWVGILILFGLLPYVIVSLALTKKMTVDCPVCEKHKNPWFLVTLLTWLLVLFLIGSIVGLAVMGGAVPAKDVETLLPGAIGAAVLGFLVLLIATLVVQSGTIQPKLITEDSITLVKVSKTFVQEVEANADDDDED
jgi:hypothetical protein